MKIERRYLIRAGAALGALVVAKLVATVLDAHHVIAASTPWPVIVLGTIIGLTYGLLAVGLVLIYRTNRIINFAHGQIGAFGAAFFGVAAVKWHVPYWVAFAMAVALAAGIGTATEIGVVRRLRDAPRLMSMVATRSAGGSCGALRRLAVAWQESGKTLCRAAVSKWTKAASSLSLASRESQAVGWSIVCSHSTSRVVLPKPAGAHTRVTVPLSPGFGRSRR